MSTELISIFLPTYNRKDQGYLQRSISSVLSQTYKEFELIVVDDGSIDGSADVINDYCRLDTRVRHERFEINTGIPAMNTGLIYPKSLGSYIVCTFDDCEIVTDHLETLLYEFKKNPDIGMAYGKGVMYTWNGDIENKVEIGMPYNKIYMDQGNNHVPNPCVMVKREVIDTVGWYDPHIILKRCCDWDLWRRIFNKYRTSFVNKILSYERGCQLVNDSLGNNYTLFSNLILRYSNTYRDELLNPLKIDKYDPFRKNLGIPLTERELRDIDFLIFENYLKTLNIEEFLKKSFDTIKVSSGITENLWYRIVTKNPYLKNSDLCVLFHGMMTYYEETLNRIKTERNRFEGMIYSMNQKKNPQIIERKSGRPR